MGNDQTDEISLALMHVGGLFVMLGGAVAVIGTVLGIILENIALALLIAIVGSGAFLAGIVVWGSGWMLRED